MVATLIDLISRELEAFINVKCSVLYVFFMNQLFVLRVLFGGSS